MKLSIITVTYNRAEKLKFALKSVGNQTYKDFEHLIIDGMSTDNTEHIVNNYLSEARYSVQYIREPDSGIFNALNKGIKLAKGEWIHFLHSDDVYNSRDALEKAFQKECQSADLIVCPIYYKDLFAEIKLLKPPKYNLKTSTFSFAHTGSLFRKSIFEKYGLYDERFKIGADAVYGYKFYPKLKFVISDVPLIIMAGSGVSGGMNLRHYLEALRIRLLYSNEPFGEKALISYIQTKQLIMHYCPLLLKIKRFLFGKNKISEK